MPLLGRQEDQSENQEFAVVTNRCDELTGAMS